MAAYQQIWGKGYPVSRQAIKSIMAIPVTKKQNEAAIFIPPEIIFS